MIDAVTLPALAGFRHAFLGRQGGVSSGLYASLNMGLGSADDPANVAENRRRGLAHVAPGAALASLYQVHSADVVTLTQAVDDPARPRADAMVTATPGLALGILTADCAPVLLADPRAGVIGAAHAGWKGALGDVTGATVSAMTALGARPEDIVAAIGPCIARASYEVDSGFQGRFCDRDPENERFFAPGRPGHHQFDLEGFVVHRLAAAGVRTIIATGIDTCADESRWFSYRRATHRGEPDYGRQLSLIALPA
ncbi:peptidoglycan editing factor PgeF [Polymorphobacter sp.]|uniref:peptidoglycan editing factor PgeF n=1 Tax=Polymorphobacter sp. TaxID=1909290 RepID=UPI003F70B71B